MSTTLSRLRRAGLPVLASLLLFASAGVALAGGDWNDGAVAWKGFDEGLSEAKAANKPICLIFFTEWCPHCTTYSQVFHDPAVVELAKKFVMIRINKDKDPATSAKYAPDGNYIPRTYFLKPDGTLMPDIHEQRPDYRYFYSESDPQSVMRSMNAVLAAAK